MLISSGNAHQHLIVMNHCERLHFIITPRWNSCKAQKSLFLYSIASRTLESTHCTRMTPFRRPLRWKVRFITRITALLRQAFLLALILTTKFVRMWLLFPTATSEPCRDIVKTNNPQNQVGGYYFPFSVAAAASRHRKPLTRRLIRTERCILKPLRWW